jgi:type II secretory pathway pseudopilin PulG
MPYCAYCGNEVAAISYAPCPSCGSPTNGAPRPSAPTGGSNAAVIVAVVLVVGLVMVAIIGILAAIAIPNLLTAMQRSKQKRTMADIRSIAVANEAYATDKNEYPKAETVGGLESALSPTYIGVIPKTDGWTRDMKYECWNESGGTVCTSYAIGSAGKDGVFEHASLREYEGGGATTNFDSDIVFINGSFVQYPQGAQRGDD